MHDGFPLILKKYFPIFLLIALSGNPIFTHMYYSKILLIISTVLFLIYTLFTIDLKILKNSTGIFVGLIIFIIVIVFFQRVTLGFVTYPGVISFFLKLILTFSILIFFENSKIDFLDSYIKILAFLAIISIPFWILNQFGYYGIETESAKRKSLIFYTSYVNLSGKLPIRNSGAFWEPGAFAGYLILALVFIALKNRKFQIGPYKSEAILIITGLFTTMSTTGFIVFGIILTIYSIQNYRWGKLITIPFIILVINLAYFNLSFMKEKVEFEFSKATKMDEDDVIWGRFGALKMDIQYIKSQPFFGNGLHVKTRFRFHPKVMDMEIGHGNGMSNFIAVWGIPFFLFWLFCVYKSAKHISHSITTSLMALFIIVLLLQGEQFLNYPIFLSFFFIPFIYTNLLSEKSKAHIIKSFLNTTFVYKDFITKNSEDQANISTSDLTKK